MNLLPVPILPYSSCVISQMFVFFFNCHGRWISHLFKSGSCCTVPEYSSTVCSRDGNLKTEMHSLALWCSSLPVPTSSFCTSVLCKTEPGTLVISRFLVCLWGSSIFQTRTWWAKKGGWEMLNVSALKSEPQPCPFPLNTQFRPRASAELS